jgi:hypothetical protein
MFFRLSTAFLIATISSFSAKAELSFVSRSDVLGLEQTYTGGWNHFVGGGVAVLDCNGDHLPDFYAAGGSGPSRLFVNRSDTGGPLSFEPAAMPALDDVIGAYPLDIDSDGNLDLVILQNGPNTILKGRGACQFEQAPEEWNFAGGDEWTTSFAATFESEEVWPTLAFGNYVDEKNPDGPFEACDKNYLMRPDGRSFGQRVPIEPGYCALSMLFSDWQRNGQVDLRISNDRQYYVFDGREQMWQMNPLSEYGDAEGWPEMKLWGMGIASRDITGDGLPEVMLTSMGDQILQINIGDGRMDTAPYSIGTFSTTPFIGDDGRPSTGWHAEFGDVNNDSLDDLFIAKGNVDQMPSNAIHDPNNLLIQQPDRTFREMADVAGIATTERSRGASVVDLNMDGKLDLIVVNRRAPIEIWQNTSTDTGNWLAIDLRQGGANTRAIGAFIEARLVDGRILTQEITVGGGHASGEAGPAHFGVGHSNQINLRITWPDGQVSDWLQLGVNAVYEIVRDENVRIIEIGDG